MSTSSNSAAYGGDGKTTVRILNADEPHINLVNTYSKYGFRLANNLFVAGSILLFPTHVFSWNVRRGIDITIDSLIVFDLIVPKTKILVIGYGQQGEPYDASLPLTLKKHGISCELLPTQNAVTTYNYLAADGIHVAGAFVPIKDEIKDNQNMNSVSVSDEYDKGYKADLPTYYSREPIDYAYERAKEVKGVTKPDLKSLKKPKISSD